jgi:hypothetical protein
MVILAFRKIKPQEQTVSATEITSDSIENLIILNKKNTETKPISTEHNSSIKDFGLGVYYFPQIGNDFGKQLCFFLESHTNLEIKVVKAKEESKYPGYYSYSTTIIGYFVTFRERK